MVMCFGIGLDIRVEVVVGFWFYGRKVFVFGRVVYEDGSYLI